MLQPEPEEAPLQAIREELAKAPAPLTEVGFGNPLAVRIGLIVAVISFFLSALSGPVAVLPIFYLMGAGFLSVYLYRRRTGQSLSPTNGARMGWMTGLFAFVIMLVLLTTVVLAISDPEIASKLLAEMKARGADVKADTLMEAFRSPSGIIQIVLVSFVVFTLFPTLGGMLGAKLLKRPR
jgi:hypothetical protein